MKALVCSVALLLACALPGWTAWEPVGLTGGGAMFTPAISPANSNLMTVNCDMGAAYISTNGGHDWRMIHEFQLRSDIDCRPVFHPTNPNIIYASSNGRLKVSRDQGLTFSNIGNLKEGLAGDIAINPSTPKILMAGTQEKHCWISRDSGETWTECNGPTGAIIGFHFDQTATNCIFAATEKGIWRSDDGGTTWTEKTRGLPWRNIQGFAAGSNPDKKLNLLYCSIHSQLENGRFAGGIYCSKDRGETWESAMGSGLNTETNRADEWSHGAISQYKQLLTTDADPLLVYACNTSTGFHPPHSDTVYRSDDGGKNWRAVYFEDPRFTNYNITPDWVTAACKRSFKGGGTPFGVAICNSDPNRIILVRNEAHITHNGGEHWFSGQTYPAPGQDLNSSPLSWICNGLVVTTTWHYYVDPFDTNRHYICYTDIGMARSTNAGKSWFWWDPKAWPKWRNTCYELAFDPQIPGKIWGAFSDVHDIPNDNIIAGKHGTTNPGGVAQSSDFGVSWDSESKGLPGKPVTSIVIDPQSPKGNRTLYAGVFEGGVYKSTDDGKTWVPENNGLGDPKNMRVYRVSLHKDGTLFAIICAKRTARGRPLMPEGVGLYRSTDKALSWQKINVSKPLLYLKDFSVDPENSQRILMGAADAGRGDQSGGLYGTENGGKTWERIGRKGPQTFGGYFHPKHKDWIYMTLTEGAPEAGLWLSKDNGLTWSPFNEIPFTNIQRVEFNTSEKGAIYLSTFGGSVWKGPETP